MCGIVGGIAERNVVPILLEGLKRLEYRGYDSAGIAVLNDKGIERIREVGKVAALADVLAQQHLQGRIGIAHTRWATHGKPTEANAHPHISGDIALVHNGIIENYAEIKAELMAEGVEFTSDTDSEVAAHLIQRAYLETGDLLKAVQASVPRFRGAYGLLIMQQDAERLIAVRSGSPLVIGLGLGENFVASDSLSLLPVTQRFIYLEEGDVAEVTCSPVQIYNKQGEAVERSVAVLSQVSDAASKGQYKHFMQKEIFEQPVAVAQTLAAGFDEAGELKLAAFGEQAAALLSKIQNIRIVACGTSYHAGMIARYWLERYARIACDVEIASELRYRDSVVRPDTLLIVISQSGETADSIAALRQGKQLGYAATLAICNVPTSSLVRETDMVFLTRAGIELGVASTKAFTTQLVALLLLTLNLAKLRHRVTAEELQNLLHALRSAPVALQQALDCEVEIKALAKQFHHKQHALFLGRGVYYPLALEGALKLKEISYIHAEAYPAGELKHGPLALVDEHMPIVALAPQDALFEKMQGNLHEVKARGGELLTLTETGLVEKLGLPGAVIALSPVPELIGPLVYSIPLQLLAYHVALIKGTDVDQPRNLAKSVTVE